MLCTCNLTCTNRLKLFSYSNNIQPLASGLMDYNHEIMIASDEFSVPSLSQMKIREEKKLEEEAMRQEEAMWQEEAMGQEETMREEGREGRDGSDRGVSRKSVRWQYDESDRTTSGGPSPARTEEWAESQKQKPERRKEEESFQISGRGKIKHGRSARVPTADEQSPGSAKRRKSETKNTHVRPVVSGPGSTSSFEYEYTNTRDLGVQASARGSNVAKMDVSPRLQVVIPLMPAIPQSKPVPTETSEDMAAPVRRGRGRPRGSSKKTSMTARPASEPATKRGRGRPRKSVRKRGEPPMISGRGRVAKKVVIRIESTSEYESEETEDHQREERGRMSARQIQPTAPSVSHSISSPSRIPARQIQQTAPSVTRSTSSPSPSPIRHDRLRRLEQSKFLEETDHVGSLIVRQHGTGSPPRQLEEDQYDPGTAAIEDDTSHEKNGDEANNDPVGQNMRRIEDEHQTAEVEEMQWTSHQEAMNNAFADEEMDLWTDCDRFWKLTPQEALPPGLQISIRNNTLMVRGRKNTNWAADICEKYHTCVLLPAFKLNHGFFLFALQYVYTRRLEPADIESPNFPRTRFQDEMKGHLTQIANGIADGLIQREDEEEANEDNLGEKIFDVLNSQWPLLLCRTTPHCDLWRWIINTRYIFATNDDGIIGDDFDALIQAWDGYARETGIPDSDWYKKHADGDIRRNIFADMRKKIYLARLGVPQVEVRHVAHTPKITTAVEEQEQEAESESQESTPVRSAKTTGNDVERRDQEAPTSSDILKIITAAEEQEQEAESESQESASVRSVNTTGNDVEERRDQEAPISSVPTLTADDSRSSGMRHHDAVHNPTMLKSNPNMAVPTAEIFPHGQSMSSSESMEDVEKEMPVIAPAHRGKPGEGVVPRGDGGETENGSSMGYESTVSSQVNPEERFWREIEHLTIRTDDMMVEDESNKEESWYWRLPWGNGMNPT